MLDKIRQDIIEILIPIVKESYPESIQKLFNDSIKYMLIRLENLLLVDHMEIQV